MHWVYNWDMATSYIISVIFTYVGKLVSHTIYVCVLLDSDRWFLDLEWGYGDGRVEEYMAERIEREELYEKEEGWKIYRRENWERMNIFR